MNLLAIDDIRDRNLGRVLELQAQAIGDKPFLMMDDREVTFGETDRIVNRIARGLASLGVVKGDRVAFYMASALEVVFLVLAVNKLGAIWIPVNTEYKGEWLKDTLIDSQPRIVVSDTLLLPRIAEIIGQVPHDHLILRDAGENPIPDGAIDFETLMDNSDAPIDLSHIHYGEIAAVLWTSGTTGRSKGVMQSHNVWVGSAERTAEHFGTAPDERVYSCLPMYNTAVWTSAIFRSLIAGIPCGLDPAFSVTQFWDRTRHFRATQTFTLGAMHMYLWNQPRRPDDADNPIRSASMVPMPDELISDFCERFGIGSIGQGFGQSEVTSVCSRGRTNKPSDRPGTLGKAADGTHIRLLDDEGRDVAVGEVGEFAIKLDGEHRMFEGYFGNPEATAAAFTPDGWYKMGDLGRVDADGYYYFVDRKKDAVRYAGRNISTMEVESVIRRHPAVDQVAVFGLPSEELEAESELAAHIVLKSDASLAPEELATYVNDNAPYYFVPRYLEFVESLPYTPTNKVQKYQLRERGVTPATWDRKMAGWKAQR
jgi:crotonobetaine/carnitine-CoA ligase